ncbi:ubiquitin carboxyl-terminal hydrolase 28 isoform X3 [Syngnathus typhle]|uniref:ubiquitin carboxyl-terminal hydrolase 28 isoform X3 n=1 Tax=Syngnathus typhle TaxID=161592 RepID=UPI002A6A54C3|nr:ubiquitin carboxyl-terminal hydrolase 28 isoform X3 [Syngnathus typhle]
MRIEESENGENSANSQTEMLINQLREITGVQDPHLLCRALKAGRGDIGHAVGLLTSQPVEVGDGGEPQELGTPTVAWEGHKGVHADELQTAIELSLQESHKAQEEEREFHRALEASAEETPARGKKKRCEAHSDMSNPADWIRKDDWPVGLRNVGNTCWFSAVIQSLFHLPVFKRLVLDYRLSEQILDRCKSHTDKRNIAFMQELRCLFALMVGSTRSFVDPSAAVELLREAFRTSEAQQDVSEFSHKLLDWLEDAFQLAANGDNATDKLKNPMVQLFYGTFVTQRKHQGQVVCNTEQFGQYPLQVNGFNNLDECLEGAMVERDIEALHAQHDEPAGRERWFKKLPPVLTFELSRFEFNTQLGRPEKIHKKLEFPQIIYMDRYLHQNLTCTHERRGEVKKVKEQLADLQQKLECYQRYGSGPNKYPLADMLQFVLEFASSKPAALSPALPSSATDAGREDGEAAEEEGGSQRIPKTCSQHCPLASDVSEEELRFVQGCLQRWRTEVEKDIHELKANIERLSQTLEGMYSDNSLCQVPYRLHAVLVHEGQASAGHYWAYIYDHANQRWMKCNDITVTESSWEELERDSFGGTTNASAYCLMYIDDRLPHLISAFRSERADDETGQVLCGMDSLPPVLRRFVQQDNRWFQQEVSEWEEQLCQAAAPPGESDELPEAEPQLPEAGADRDPQASAPIEPVPQAQGAAAASQAEARSHPEPDAAGPLEDAATAAAALPSSECQPDDGEPDNSDMAEPERCSDVAAVAAEREPQSQSPEVELDANHSLPDLSVNNEDAQEEENEEEVEETARGDVEASSEEAPRRQSDQEQPMPAAGRRQAQNEVSEVEIPNVGRIMVRADADGYNEEMMLTPAMQGIILAIAKARQAFDSEGPEAGLIKAFHEEYSRLYELSQEETTPREDARLQHALVYFFQNRAPKRVIERTLLEQFTDRNLSYDERAIGIMREARAKLRLIKPEDMDMDEYLQWHDDYRTFRTVFVYLLTGLEQYQHGKMREALTYLAHAYDANAALLASGEKRGVDTSLIALYRRKCLTSLNERATRLFASGDESKVEDSVAIMDEAVIPCLHLMSREVSSQEDRDTMESIRSQWCCCLGQDMDDSLQMKLGEFLPRVLDCSTQTAVLKDPPKVHVNQAHDLCSRLAAVMESICNTAVVAVK